MNLETFEDVKKVVDSNKVRTIEINIFKNDSTMFYHKTSEGINLYFTKSWCKENKELLNIILTYIIQKFNDKKLSIKSGSLINDKIIKEISQNRNIEQVSFGNLFDPYILKESDYQVLKNTIKKIETDGVEDALKYNFDEIIDYNRRKNLFYYNKYDALQKENLYVYEPINKECINYIKYIGDETKLIVSTKANIIDIIKKLRNSGKNNVIAYRLGNNKKQFNKELFKSSINTDNVFIQIGTQEYTLKEYIEYEKILYSFIKPTQNLSPFEKYIYAYDIVKKFKKYKENKKDKMKARRLYEILNNNYMVCVGYSEMLGDLLSKLGIENMELHAEVGLQPYKATAQLKSKYGDKWNEIEKQEKYKLIDEQKNYIPDSWGAHSRRIVHIVDEKYGINGLYFSDPTWDNDLENDSYNYLLMTSEEVLTSKNKFRFENAPYELLYSHSVQEFNDKLNVILNKTKKSSFMDHQKQFEYIQRELSLIIKSIDINFYNKLKQKYEFIKNEKFKIDDIYNLPKEVTDYLYDVATYISSNVNNLVSGKTILEAVKNVYNTIYVDGISEEQIQNIQNYNSELAERNFKTNKFK